MRRRRPVAGGVRLTALDPDPSHPALRPVSGSDARYVSAVTSPEALSSALPPHVVAGLLRAVSSSLGDDLVLWATVRPGDIVSVEAVVDPAPEGQVAADRIPRQPFHAPESIPARVAQLGEPVVVPVLDLDDHAVDDLPDPWPSYLKSHPLHGLVIVPETAADGTVTVLIAGRRRTGVPYGDDDLAVVRDAAQRIAGVARAGTDETGPHRFENLAVHARRRRTSRWMTAVGVGVALPAAVLALLLPTEEPGDYLPGTLFLLCCVLAALLAGVHGAVVAAVGSALGLWWGLKEPRYSFRIDEGADIVGMGVFVTSGTLLIVIVSRLDRARARERAERRLSDVLLDEAPVAMAVFDRDLRFRRVNQQMVELNERTADEHLGLRPGDLSPVVGQLYEPLLARVRDRGEVIEDHPLSMSMPEVGLQRHWRLNAQPLVDDRGDIVGVSAAVADVTEETVLRERADGLLALSQDLANALSADAVYETVARHLVMIFRARAAVLARDGDVLVARAIAGFDDVSHGRWLDRRVPLDVESPLSRALRSPRPVPTESPADFDEHHPELAAARLDDWDAACLSVAFGPGRAAGRGDGVLYVGWVAPRRITPRSITLMDTIATVATLALERIVATAHAHQIEFRSALDAMLDAVAIGRAIRDDDGAIVDFELEFVNARSVDGAGRSAREMIGRRVCELYPDWPTSGMLHRFIEVVETGRPYESDRLRYDGLTEDGVPITGWWSIQVNQFGDGYIAASRDVTSIVQAELAAQEAQRQREAERITIELLQGAALPGRLPDVAGIRLAAEYVPSAVDQPVGGDWYDVFSLDSDRVGLVIADVAGHGRSAAAFMLQVRNVFRAIAVEHAEPGEVMFRANEVTHRLNEPDGPFVTCCFAVLHVPTRRLHWAQAGHFPPFVQRRDEPTVALASRPGVPLAMFPRQRYTTSVEQLEDGDRVVMFTDGLVERRDEPLDVGLERLRGRIDDLRPVGLGHLVETIASEVTGRFDDLAVVALEICDPAA